MSKKRNNEGARLARIEQHLLNLSQRLDRVGLDEYFLNIKDTKKFIRRNITAGILRGVGSAIGFSILGAIVILLLRNLAASSIPYIADFIARIMEIAEGQ